MVAPFYLTTTTDAPVLLRYQCRRFHPTHVARRDGESKFGAVAHLSAPQTGGIFDGSVRKLTTGVRFSLMHPTDVACKRLILWKNP